MSRVHPTPAGMMRNDVYATCTPHTRDPEMVYPRITGVKVIPRLSPGYQFLKVMDNAWSAYVLQCTVQSRPAAGLSAASSG